MVDEGKGKLFDRVDLDLAMADTIPTARFHLGPLPKTERDRDVARQNGGTKLLAELHGG